MILDMDFIEVTNIFLWFYIQIKTYEDQVCYKAVTTLQTGIPHT